MSYDLFVFEPDVAPKERDAFLAWFEEIVEGDSSDAPAFTTPRLQAWYRDMIGRFPPMNGPDAPSDDDAAFDSPMITGYQFASAAIYLDFRWSVAREAYDQVLNLAAKHDVGFFDVSGDDGAVWLPSANGGYSVAHGGGPGEHDAVTEISEAFREADRGDQSALMKLLKRLRVIK